MAEVIIDFVGQSNMKPVEDSLNKIDGLLEDQKKQYTDINASAEKQAQIVKKTAGEFDKLEESVKDTSKALGNGVLKKVTDEITNLGKKADELSKNFKTSKAELKALQDQIKSGNLNTEQLAQAKKKANELKDEIKKLNDEIKNTPKPPDGLEKSFKSAKAELKDLQNQILSGKLSGEQLAQATKRAAELKDNIGDTSNAIKMLASDTRSIDLVVEGARGLVAGFTLAKSATALFGDENKELEKSLVKVQASMAVLTSVQEIANIVTTKGGIATTVYGYALKGLEVIQKTFAVSSAAAWAIATAGITLVITGVVALIAYMSDFIGKSEDGVKKFEEYTKRIDKSFEAKEKAQERYLNRIKAEGKTEKEINDAAQVFARNRRDELNRQAAELERRLQRNKEVLKYDKDDQKTKELVGKLQDELNKKKAKAFETETELIDLQREAKELVTKTSEEQKKAADEKKKKDTEEKKRLDDLAKQKALAWLEEQKRSQEAAKQIEENRNLQLALEKDFYLTREEIDEAYLQFVIDNAEKGTTSFVDFEKQKRAELEATKNKEIELAKQRLTVQTELDKNRALQLGLMKDTGLTMQQIDDEYFAWVKTKRADEKADFEEFEKFKREEFKKTAEKQKETQQAVINGAIEFTKIAYDTIFQIAEQNRQAQTEGLLTNLEKEKESELTRIQQLAEKGIITKEQEESRKAAITKKYADQERAIKKRAWEAERQAKLAQAAINGALAITQILATVSYADFGITKAIQIALTAATTAAQIALIASQPTPAFAKGTKGGKKTPKGFKIVGEEGPELIYTPGGEKVITAPDTAKILDAYNINTTKMPNMNKDKGDVTQIPIFDYDKLSRAVASEMIKQPRLQVNIDEKGFSKRIIENRKRIEYLNNKFKFN